MDSRIDRIASNKTSGAAEILRLASGVFSQLRVEHVIVSLDETKELVYKTAVSLVRAQPDMSPLLGLATVAVSAADNATNALDALKSVEQEVLRFISQAETAARNAALQAAKLILTGAVVMTHSRSSTVLCALLEAARSTGKNFFVVATESRPGLEGLTLAEELARENIQVRLIPDSAASLAMYGVDLIFVGADTITPDVVVNKIGTMMIGLAARELHIPFYSVCDTSKFINSNYSRSRRSPVRDTETDKLRWSEHTDKSIVADGYFEPIPLTHFTGIITEEGVLSPEDAGRRANRASTDPRLLDAIEEFRR